MSTTKVLSILLSGALTLALSASQASAQCRGGSQGPGRSAQQNLMPALMQMQQQAVLRAGMQRQALQVAALRQQQQRNLMVAALRQQQLNGLLIAWQLNAAAAQRRTLQTLTSR